jgi:hypothetical protein
MSEPKDFLFKTNVHPERIDRILSPYNAGLVQGGGNPWGFLKVDGAYVVRCFSPAGILKLVLQEYGQIVREFDGVEW